MDKQMVLLDGIARRLLSGNSQGRGDHNNNDDQTLAGDVYSLLGGRT